MSGGYTAISMNREGEITHLTTFSEKKNHCERKYIKPTVGCLSQRFSTSLFHTGIQTLHFPLCTARTHMRKETKNSSTEDRAGFVTLKRSFSLWQFQQENYHTPSQLFLVHWVRLQSLSKAFSIFFHSYCQERTRSFQKVTLRTS